MPSRNVRSKGSDPAAAPRVGERVFLIDGTALCYRGFYAIRELSTSDGRPTNAVYAFAMMLGALRAKQHPEYLAVAFDLGKPTFRHERFAAYKEHRPPMPSPLVGQLPLIRELLAAYRVPVIEHEGYEAEDVLATVARQLAGKRTVILVTADKDALQLIGPRVKVYNPHKDDGVLYDVEQVVERYGVGPDRMVELMALMGDKVDNIPGVPGIGEKTAAGLMRRFGSLEALYAHLDQVPSDSLRASLTKHRDQVAMARELAQIKADAPVEVSLETLRVGEPDWAALRRLFRQLEFKRLIAEVDAASPPPAQRALRVHRVTDAASMSGFQKALQATEPASIMVWRPAAAPGEAELFAADGFVAIAWKAQEAWLVPLDTPAPTGKALRAWLADATRPKLGHDLKSIWLQLRALGLELNGLAGDTMIAGHLSNPAKTNPSLGELAEDWLELRLPAWPSADAGSSASRMQDLAQHVGAILGLHQTLARRLQETGLDRLYRELELPLVRVLAEMETTGVAIDRSLLDSMRVTMAANLQRLTHELYQLAGSEFNPNSPKQLADILFTKLKLPVLKRTKTGPSTDSEVLRQLAASHPFPQKLLEVRELSKLVSTYLDALPKLIRPSTGRLHTTFNQTGTATGRLSSSDPNLQNIPMKTELGRSIRKAFIPGERGWLLITADYSQIELRILAHLSGDPELIETFRQGRDIHRHTASLVYGVPEGEITPEMRSAMKAVNFGILYGMSAHGLTRELGISHDEAGSFIDAYFARYPKVRAYLDSQIAQARRDGFVQTLLGRKRFIPEVNSPDPNMRQFGERMAINAPIQGTAADLIKLAMVRLADRLRERRLKSRMILQVHDELVFEGSPGEQRALAELVRDTMEHAVEMTVPLSVVVKTGPNWLDLTEVTV